MVKSLKNKNLFLKRQSTAASFYNQLHSVNQFLKSEDIPHERLLLFPTEKPEFPEEEIQPKIPMKKKTIDDIWITEEEPQINPVVPFIQWCLCAWICGQCDMRYKKKKPKKIRKYDDVIIQELSLQTVVFFDL